MPACKQTGKISFGANIVKKPEVVNRESWMGITPFIYDSRLTIYDHRWVKKPEPESGKGNFSGRI